jgi:hypothetical protein
MTLCCSLMSCVLALIFGFPRVFFSSPPRGGVMSAPDLEEP